MIHGIIQYMNKGKRKNNAQKQGHKNTRIPVKKVFAFSPVILLLILLVFLIYKHKPVVAFYGIQTNIRQEIMYSSFGKSSVQNSFRIVTLDPQKSLSSQIHWGRYPDIIFVYEGSSSTELSERATPLDRDMMRSITPPIGQSMHKGSKYYGLPVLLDHFEMAADKQVLLQNRGRQPATMDELVRIAQGLKGPGYWPVLCAGGQDDDLLLFIGSITEARYGPEGWNTLTGKLKQNSNFSYLLKNTALKSVLDELVHWQTSGILHPEWYRMTDHDLQAVLATKSCAFVFMPLSTHRTLPRDFLENYRESPIPGNGTKPRMYSMPTLIGILPAKAFPSKKAREFLCSLIETDRQTDLAGRTGLAPVCSMAQTKDRQASDLRFWASSAQALVGDPANAAFDNPKQRAAFSRDIREYLKTGGTGY
jgi:hypothetical protein